MKKFLLAGMLLTMIAVAVDASPRNRRARRRSARQVKNVQSNTIRSYNNYGTAEVVPTADSPAVISSVTAPNSTYVTGPQVTSYGPVIDESGTSTNSTEPLIAVEVTAPAVEVDDPLPTVTDSGSSGGEGIPVVRVSAAPVTVVAAPVLQPVAAPVAVNTAMAELNSIRAQRGLHALIEDPNLSAVAYRKASIQARRGAMYHPGGSMGGARFEGVGMGARFTTCYQNATNARFAGAATVRGANGRRYHCLLLK